MRELGALLDKAESLMYESGALLQGKFRLASGKESSYYFDSKMFSLHGQGQHLAGELLFDLISQCDHDGFGGMEVSAIPLVGAVARAAFDRGLPCKGFYVKKERKEHGTARAVEGFLPPEGSRVVILDDVVTTGESAQLAVDAVQARGLRVVLVAALVERHEEGGKVFIGQGIPFASVFKTTAEGRLVPAMSRGEPVAAVR